jgi:type IV fimbrial biogenesis protein FimT
MRINTERTQLTRNSSRGFSLLELMLAVTVLSLALVMAVPSMTTMTERRQTIGAVERIYGELQLARSTAVAMSQPMFMNISAGNDWALGVSDNTLCDPVDNDPAWSIPDVNDANAITHRYTVLDNDDVVVNADSAQVTFFSQRGTATPVNITVTSQGRTGYVVNIVVRPLGQVSICSPDTDPSVYLSSYRICG